MKKQAKKTTLLNLNKKKLQKYLENTESNENLNSENPIAQITAQVSIMGLPNVGKSSLFNRIIKKNIAITSSISGSTRDINKQNVRLNRFDITLIDTGGLQLDISQLKNLAWSQDPKKPIDSKNSQDSKSLTDYKYLPRDSKNITESTSPQNTKNQSQIAQILRKDISAHSFNMLKRSDVIIYVIDGSRGLPDDNDVKIFRAISRQKPTILAINKVDNDKMQGDLSRYLAFGADFISISVLHNRGITRLLEQLELSISECMQRGNIVSGEQISSNDSNNTAGSTAHILDYADYKNLDSTNLLNLKGEMTGFINKDSNPKGQDVELIAQDSKNPQTINIGIIGRPNVGKSSILNALTWQGRSLVSSIAGTTIDPVDEEVVYKSYTLRFVDTAGIRRRGRIEGIEKYALDRTQRTLKECDIALIVLDSTSEFCSLDSNISLLANAHGLGTIVLFNKWDIATESFKSKMREFKFKFKFLEYAPVMTISSVTKRNILALKDKIIEIYHNFMFRIPTTKLNECIQNATKLHTLPSHKGKIVKIYYTTQFDTKPPKIALVMNKPEALHFSYKRYLINTLRANFNLTGVPIIIESKGR